MTLINRKQVRRFILAYAKRNRAHPFTRVSAPVYDQVDAKVREACRRIVDSQPSVGRTIS